MTDRIVENIVNKFQMRSDVGIHKYGTTLEANNKDNFLKHVQEELMDATLYVEKLMSLDQELTRMIKKYPNDIDLGAAVRNLIK